MPQTRSQVRAGAEGSKAMVATTAAGIATEIAKGLYKHYIGGRKVKEAPPANKVYLKYPKGYREIKKKRAKSLKARVRALEVAQQDTVFQFRFRDGQRVEKPNNQHLTNAQVGVTLATYQNTLNKLEFYDPATGNFTQRSIFSGTDQKSVHVKSIKTDLWTKNSYQVPCYVKIYMCRPRKDQSSNPASDISNGIADVVTDPVTMLPTNQLMRITDSQDFTANWKHKLIKKKLLQPGESFSVSHTVKDIQFDPTKVGSETNQKNLKSFFFLTELTSHYQMVSHHPTYATVEIGITRAAVDQVWTQVTTVKYDGGVKALRLGFDDQIGDIGNALTGTIPIPDNLGFNAS